MQKKITKEEKLPKHPKKRPIVKEPKKCFEEKKVEAEEKAEKNNS